MLASGSAAQDASVRSEEGLKQEVAVRQEAPAAPRSSADKNDTRVTLHVKDQPVVDVIKYIAERAGVNIVPAEGIDDKVTVDLDLVPWRLALEIVAEKAGCVVIEKAANVLRVEQPPRVTVRFPGWGEKTLLANYLEPV